MSKNIFALVMFLLLLTACDPKKWILKELLSRDVNWETENATFYTCNCTQPLSEEASCTIDSSNVIVTGVGLDGVGFLAEISHELDIGIGAGNSINLPAPQDIGFIYKYEIVKKYEVLTGNGRFVDSDGNVKRAQYETPRLSCDIGYKFDPVLIPCEDKTEAMLCGQEEPISTITREELEINETRNTSAFSPTVPGTMSSIIENPNIHVVAWSSDGHYIALGGENKFVNIWDTEQARIIQNIPYPHPVRMLKWSHNGMKIVVVSQLGTAEVFDRYSGQSIHSINTENAILSIAWSPDDLHLVTGESDNLIYIWRTDEDYYIDKLIGHQDDVVDVGWSPDGKSIVSASLDNTVRFWFFDKSNKPLVLNIESPASKVVWSDDGQWLAAGDKSGRLYIWEKSEGWMKKHEQIHTGSILDIAWVNNNTRVATVGIDGKLRVTDINTLNVEIEVPHQTMSIAASPNGQELAIAGHGQPVKKWSDFNP